MEREDLSTSPSPTKTFTKILDLPYWGGGGTAVRSVIDDDGKFGIELLLCHGGYHLGGILENLS